MTTSTSHAAAPSANTLGDDVLVVKNLVRRYGDLTAVDGVSFRIAPGETYGLLGPNGAGKTTTISVVAGLIAADEGTVTVVGRPMGPRQVAVKAHVGLVPQELAIYPELSGRENLMFFGRLQGLRGKDLGGRVAEVLDLIGLADRAKDATKEYSGGMKRRLNIGIGLLHRPTLLILDEPTVGVDPQSRNAILESVEALSVEGMAVLYTTHYIEEAERLCDRIGIIDAGRLQAEGTRAELIRLTGEVDRIHLQGSGQVVAAAEAIRALPAVDQVDADRRTLALTVRDAPTAVAGIVTAATAAGMTLSDVEITRPNLESVFLQLTGKALRD
ncbi:ABC transporter ATP-binding protein [Cellulomonas sp. KRMCY2]|uniref:ABC transporter ATP-binding protein n=1 Tax=Cellulomonas sp. KRMCY2 TaxID=1304865 RepID=UPI00045E99DB|nr:ABC transporter ATP-binding protein [Cellulomonas sp. KRMCY2]